MRILPLAVAVLISSAALAGKPARMTRRVQVGDVITSPAFGRIDTGWRTVREGVQVPVQTPRFASVQFVVEKAEFAHGGRDTLGPIPAGWTVLARQLRRNGTYDPRGKTIEFHQSRNHTPDVAPADIVLVKTLRPTFVAK
jgi:hypothetical protein